MSSFYVFYCPRRDIFFTLTVQLRLSVVALDGSLVLLSWKYLKPKVELGDWVIPATNTDNTFCFIIIMFFVHRHKYTFYFYCLTYRRISYSS